MTTVSRAFVLALVMASCSDDEPPPRNQPPVARFWVSPKEGLAPMEVTMNGSASSDVDGQIVSYRWRFDDGSDGLGVTYQRRFGSGEHAIELTVTDDDGATGSLSDEVIGRAPELPPDPVTVAPPLDPSVATTVASASFLFEGSDPIQREVVPGALLPARLGVVRGRVVDEEAQPLPGVVVSVYGAPELGWTRSRVDGRFDLALRSAETLTLRFEVADKLSAERQVHALGWVELPDVALIDLDSAVTRVVMGGTQTQVARSNSVTDDRGTRRATIIFPPATKAELELADGTREVVDALSVRATEYSAGAHGESRMPARLPPTSGYTYAVELSADEGTARGARHVRFEAPISFYVENFLGFPTGTHVPVGIYERSDSVPPAEDRVGLWVPEHDGRVIEILAVEAGMAQLDFDGDGVAETPLQLQRSGIGAVGDAERRSVAELYSTGDRLWRVPLQRFSTVDFNFSIVAAAGARRPMNAAPSVDQLDQENPVETHGFGAIDLLGQTLRESVRVAGTPFSLCYASDRAPGRSAAFSMLIPLTGESVPDVLSSVELEVSVAGQAQRVTFSPAPNLSHVFAWDGRDVYGRAVQGSQDAIVRITYVYPGVYEIPPDLLSTFAFPSGSPSEIRSRSDVRMTQTHVVRLGQWDARSEALGGWTLDVHHAFDVGAGALELGNGRRIRSNVAALDPIIPTDFAGGPTPRSGPYGLVLGPGGEIYAGTWQGYQIVRVDPRTGAVEVVAGDGERALDPSEGDGGPAREARFGLGAACGLGPDGSLYVCDFGYSQVRRIRDGIISTVAGDGDSSDDPDGGLAVLTSVRVQSLAVAPDGALYIGTGYGRIRRVGTDGRIETILGDGVRGYEGDGGPARAARMGLAAGLAIGPDGALYAADADFDVVRRIGPDGIVTTVAGNGTPGNSGDGGPATEATLDGPNTLAIGPDGTIFIGSIVADVSRPERRVRVVHPDGTISTLVGGGDSEDATSGPALRASLSSSSGLAYDPLSRTLWLAELGRGRLSRIRLPFPGFDGSPIGVASRDGQRMYSFDANGRHLETKSAWTGATELSFGYDAVGRLVSITSAGGQTTIERTAEGAPTAIVAPQGERTELELEGGHLSAVRSPGRALSLAHTPGGLLTDLQSPSGAAYHFDYDSGGRLVRAADPEGGFSELARARVPAGVEVEELTAAGLRKVRAEEDAQVTTVTTVDFAGLTEIERRGRDGSVKTSRPDGVEISTWVDADPRFGLQAPFVSRRLVERLEETFEWTGQRTLTDGVLEDLVSIGADRYRREYDTAARRFEISSPEGRVATIELDPLGREVQRTLGGRTRTIAYDELGRIDEVAEAGRTLTFARDPELTATDGVGRTLVIRREAGRIATASFADAEIAFGYDTRGNLTSIMPPGRPAHELSYDNDDRWVRHEPPGTGGGVTIARDLAGRLQTVTRGDRSLEIERDLGGRPSAWLVDRGAYRFQYGPTGDLARAESPDGIVDELSVSMGLVSRARVSGTISGQVDYAYDGSLRARSMTVEGVEVAREYDSDGLATRVGPVSLERDSSGLLRAIATGIVIETIDRDEHGRVAHRAVAPGVYEATYVRDAAGRLTEETEIVGGQTTTRRYSYDSIGRLSEVGDGSGATVESYAWDPNGNRISGSGGTGVFDDQDRLVSQGAVSYEHGLDGRRARRAGGGADWTYVYDELGQLLSARGAVEVSYAIDGLGRRVARRVNGVLTSAFLYGHDDQLLGELDGDQALRSVFVYASRRDVPDAMISGARVSRIVCDHRGSPRVVADASTGELIAAIDYDSFGKVLVDTHPGLIPFGFAGGLRDPSTGLQRHGLREYDPESGRFTAPDPLHFFGGSSNLYGYALGDPVNFVDPLGAKPEAVREDSPPAAEVSLISGVPMVQRSGESVFVPAYVGMPLYVGDVVMTGQDTYANVRFLQSDLSLDEGVTARIASPYEAENLTDRGWLEPLFDPLMVVWEKIMFEDTTPVFVGTQG